jgi:ATP-dependent Lon protease
MQENQKKDALPVLPVRTQVLYPKCIGTFQINRRRSLNLILDNQDGGREIILVLIKKPEQPEEAGVDDVYPVGMLSRIVKINKISDDILSVTFEGVKRVKVDRFILEEPYFIAYYEDIEETKTQSKIPRQVYSEIVTQLKQLTLADPSYSGEILNIAEKSTREPGYFCDCIVSNLHVPLAIKQSILEAPNPVERMSILKKAIEDEIKTLEIQAELDTKVKQSISKSRRELFLREQLKQIHRELGEEDPEERLIRYFKDKLDNMVSLPSYVKDRINLEIERMKLLSIASAEYGATKGYIELLLSLPWNKCTEDEDDLKKIEDLIDREYYGPRRIKDRIIEYLVVRKLTAQIRSPILCLCGPPGTGKSSLANAIARALGREVITINAAGISLVEDIKGDMRTFLGAMPGNVMRALVERKSANPVVIVDDIDKMSMYSSSMSLPLAMLEILDPKQNKSFIDAYVGLPFDLSRAIFITTVEALDEIPAPLTERMEVIEFTGYIDSEKIEIGQKFIIPKLCRAHNLKEGTLTFTAEALRRIIRHYTLESGLIGFKREIELICRKVSRQLAVNKRKRKIRITIKNLETYLGPPVYIPEMIESNPEIGVANGLAWTGSGGDIMLIEGIKMRGAGGVIFTGSLGEVMKESIQASHSYVRARAEMLGIDYNDFVNYDIHIHFPSGAIPKDGPSAGVTISTVIASLMSDRPIANDIALTGEVSLRGKVLAVSGIKEKIAAAHRAGIFKVILPRDNEKDIKEMPQQILEDMEFILVEKLDEVFEHALMDFELTDHSLEKLLYHEVEKIKEEEQAQKRKVLQAKKRKRKNSRRTRKE